MVMTIILHHDGNLKEIQNTFSWSEDTKSILKKTFGILLQFSYHDDDCTEVPMDRIYTYKIYAE